MAQVVTWSAIVAAAICLAVGIWSAIYVLPKQRDVLQAVTPPELQNKNGVPGPVTNQSISTTVDSVAKLAGALKDLDRVAQMFTLALGFLSVSAVSAGVDAIARAVK
jgi:hypothetical protein